MRYIWNTLLSLSHWFCRSRRRCLAEVYKTKQALQKLRYIPNFNLTVNISRLKERSTNSPAVNCVKKSKTRQWDCISQKEVIFDTLCGSHALKKHFLLINQDSLVANEMYLQQYSTGGGRKKWRTHSGRASLH